MVIGELIGNGDLELDNRLQELEARIGRALLECHRAGDFERHFRGVDRVLLAVVEDRAHVNYGIAGEDALFHRLADALLDRWAVVVRDDAADDLVLKLEAAAAWHRLHLDPADAVLPVAAGLADVAPLCLR